MVSCTDLAWNTPLVSTTTRPSSVSTAEELANASTNASPGWISASWPLVVNGWCDSIGSSPVNSRSAVSSRSMAGSLSPVDRCVAGEMETCFTFAVVTTAELPGSAGPEPGGAPAPGARRDPRPWPPTAGSTRCRCGTSRPRPTSRSAPSTATSRRRSGCSSKRWPSSRPTSVPTSTRIRPRSRRPRAGCSRCSPVRTGRCASTRT